MSTVFQEIHTFSFSGITPASCTALQSNNTHPNDGLAKIGCPANTISAESPNLIGQSADVPTLYQSIRVLVRLVPGRRCCEDWVRCVVKGAMLEGREEGREVVPLMAACKVTSPSSEGYRTEE